MPHNQQHEGTGGPWQSSPSSSSSFHSFSSKGSDRARGNTPSPTPIPPASNTSQPWFTTMMGSLPLSSSGSHQFPPPHPPDQVIGGDRDSTPSPAGMDISHKPPSAMARGHIRATRMDILHEQSSVPTTGSVATTSWPSNVSITKQLVSDRPASPWPSNVSTTKQLVSDRPASPSATNGDSDKTGSDDESDESSATSIKFHVQDIYHESYSTSHDPATGWENSTCNIPGKWELFQEMGLAPKPTETWKTNVTSAYTYQPVPEQVSSLLAREKHPHEDNHDTTTDQSNKRRKLILKDGRDITETFLNKEREKFSGRKGHNFKKLSLYIK